MATNKNQQIDRSQDPEPGASRKEIFQKISSREETFIISGRKEIRIETSASWCSVAEKWCPTCRQWVNTKPLGLLGFIICPQCKSEYTTVPAKDPTEKKVEKVVEPNNI